MAVVFFLYFIIVIIFGVLPLLTHKEKKKKKKRREYNALSRRLFYTCFSFLQPSTARSAEHRH